MGGEKFRPVGGCWFALEGFVHVTASTAVGVRDLYSVAAFLGTMEILGTMERLDFVGDDDLESELRPKPAINRLRAFLRNFDFVPAAVFEYVGWLSIEYMGWLSISSVMMGSGDGSNISIKFVVVVETEQSGGGIANWIALAFFNVTREERRENNTNKCKVSNQSF